MGAVIGGILGAVTGAFSDSADRNRARDEWRLGESERRLWVETLKGEAHMKGFGGLYVRSAEADRQRRALRRVQGIEN